MRTLKQLQEKFDDQILNQQQEDEGLVVKKKISWAEFGKLGGRPSATIRKDLTGVSGGKRSNRKGKVDEPRKREFSACQKLKIVENINEKIKQGLLQGQGEREFWPPEAKKLGINSERLRDIMAREDMWKQLVIKHQRGAKGKRMSKKASKHQRASGGGRKREFQPQINQLKGSLLRERSAGHSISKEDVIKEMESLIHARAEQCLINAQQPNQHPESAKAWENEAKSSHTRIKKLEESKSYRKQYANALINWIGARAYQKEQSAEITAQEEKIRAQLTWHGIDHKPWLIGAASLQELESANIVSNPASVISNRALISIGMSDQVPLWAKAMPSKMIFCEHELAGHSYQERKGIKELRDEIETAPMLIKKKSEEDGAHPPQIIGEICQRSAKSCYQEAKQPEQNQQWRSGGSDMRQDKGSATSQEMGLQ